MKLDKKSKNIYMKRRLFENIPETPNLDIQITQECILKCPICINSQKLKGTINFVKLKKFLKKAKEFRLIKINGLQIGGGEPFLNNIIKAKTIDLIRFAKKLGLIISVNTNGLMLNEKDFKKLIHYVDIFHFPIDASIPEVQYQIRKNTQIVSKNIENIKILNKLNYDGLIKIATVLTQKNKENIFKMPHLFKTSKIKFHIWRIYQFRCDGIGKTNKDKFSISNSEFRKIIGELKKCYYGDKIAPNPNKGYVDKLFVLPDGKLGIGNIPLKSFSLDNFNEKDFVSRYIDYLKSLEAYLYRRKISYKKIGVIK